MRSTLYFMLAILAAATTVSASYNPASVTWSRLELEASKFFMTARSEVELGQRPSAKATGELLDPRPWLSARDGAREGLAPRGAESGVLDIRTRIMSRTSEVRFWFDPGDGRALQRSSHDISKRRLRHRTYRYTRGGVLSHTLRPNDGEADRPYTGWTRVEEKHIAFEPAGGPAVTEAAGLLYLIPAGDFRAPGAETRLHVFTRGQVRQVDVTVAGLERIGVDYVEVSGDRERAVRGEIEALRVAVRPRAEESGEFKLLGLEGDIDIYLEPRTRVLLLVTGRIQVAGKVRLRLRRAVLD